MDTIEALMTRVTHGALTDPPPDDAATRMLVEAAMRAPDHGRLRPWRFILIQGPARARFGELMAGALRKRDPNASDVRVQQESAKALRAPAIMVVATRFNAESRIPQVEQLLSAGAAAQNILLAAHALGLGAAWKTGDAAYDATVKAGLGINESDSVVAFIYLGSRSGASPPPSTVDPEQFLHRWQGKAA
ncbi:MAG: nitroreductase [Lautropia sp.]